MAAQLTAVHDWAPAAQPLPVLDYGADRTNWPFLKLLLIALAALAVHGYHLGVDDAEIYVPAVKKVADPALFPFSSNEFFLTHAHLSLFSDLVGNFARWTHVPVDLAIFLSHVAGVFLLMLACWRVSCICFESKFAHWGSVLVVAAVLTIPITGTGLFLMDSYVTARSISTPLSVLAVAAWLGKGRRESMLWIFLTALVHPQMAVYTGGLVVCLTLVRGSAFAAALPVLFEFVPARGPAAEALHSRTYFLVTNWAWYEWVGVIAPILLLTWFAWARPRSAMPEFSWLARALVPYGVVSTLVASALTISPRLENLTRLQPMRAFHLLYALFFILLGGLLGEYLLRARLWRWCAVLIPVASAMGMVQVAEFSSSPHIEWPLAREQNGNDWINAFLWVRDNTPKDALFALDPEYMSVAAEDQHGFRAVAERSVLADEVKDSGAVSLFPQLAEDWKAQVGAQKNWNGFQLGDYERLRRQYPVNWIVTNAPGPFGFKCPYRNSTLAVCHLDSKELPVVRPETD